MFDPRIAYAFGVIVAASVLVEKSTIGMTAEHRARHDAALRAAEVERAKAQKWLDAVAADQESEHV